MGILKTREELKDYRAAVSSFPFFLRHYVYISDAGGVAFRPWPWQLPLARVLVNRRWIAILKARQLGVSWIVAAYALWVAITNRGATVLLMSQTLTDAHKLLGKVKFIFDRLPEWMQPEVGRNNTECLEFPGLVSIIEALPSTEKAGRGTSNARLVIADEWAFHQWAEANFDAVEPAVEASGQFIGLSTANGIGNFFADIVAKARSGSKRWHFVFLPYFLRPGRDEAWYEGKRETYTNPKKIHQEYPRDADEAFIQTGRPVFDQEYLRVHRERCRKPLPKDQWPPELAAYSPDELRIFEFPRPHRLHVAGADVAEGLEHGDYSDMSVIDVTGDPVEVLTLHGHWPTDVYAKMIDTVARVYPGLYGVERNNHGHAVLMELKRLGTPGLHRERAVFDPRSGKELSAGHLGWLTSATSKPLMIDEFEQALRLFGVQLSDAMAIPELTFYQNKKDGSTGAPEGQWDDRVISRAIAWQMRKHLRTSGSAGAVGGSREVVAAYEEMVRRQTGMQLGRR